MIERGLILSDGDALVLGTEFEQAAPAGSAPIAPSPDLTLRRVEREHIESVLARCGWRVEGRGKAADMLNLNASTLRYRMKILGIRRPG